MYSNTLAVQLCEAGNGEPVPTMTGAGTFQYWKDLEEATRAHESQLLRPLCTADVRLWRSRHAFLTAPGSFEERTGEDALRLDDLDDARVLRVRVHRPDWPVADNAPFYARTARIAERFLRVRCCSHSGT